MKSMTLLKSKEKHKINENATKKAKDTQRQYIFIQLKFSTETFMKGLILMNGTMLNTRKRKRNRFAYECGTNKEGKNPRPI